MDWTKMWNTGTMNRMDWIKIWNAGYIPWHENEVKGFVGV